jgi:hypothetical protein
LRRHIWPWGVSENSFFLEKMEMKRRRGFMLVENDEVYEKLHM